MANSQTPNRTAFVRRDTPVVCARCGRDVPRQARQQKYCSTHCRELAKQRTRKALLGQGTGAPPNPPKNISDSNAFQVPKSGSRVGPNVPRKVLEAVFFGGSPAPAQRRA